MRLLDANTLTLEETIRLKCELLIEGCNIEALTVFPEKIHHKKIHLYAHSDEDHAQNIPDDILIGKGDAEVICRIRYQSTSSKTIVTYEDQYYIADRARDVAIPIFFVEDVAYEGAMIDKTPLTSICSLLGTDLLGITPSNYCFYFKDQKQCKFCEIFQTYQKKVEYNRSLKKIPLICEAITQALQLEPRFSHLALTTGNIVDYDYTFQYFIDIGNALLENPLTKNFRHVLATLMPPENSHLIYQLSQTLFNKLYFPIEVFEYEHFKIVCPGKDEYGYQRILDHLSLAETHFGKGNVYTNLVYGVQSLDSSLSAASYHPERENEKSLHAVTELLKRGIIPAFTLYHFGGYNQIGKIALDVESSLQFFLEWGRLVFASGLVPKDEECVLFDRTSLSNTLYNDTFRLARSVEGMESLKLPF